MGSDRKFWLEIRNDENVDKFGEELYSERETAGMGGRPSYAELRRVWPGDVVFHYQMKAIRGFSMVSSFPDDDGEAVRVEVTGYTGLKDPVTLEAIRNQVEAISDIRQELEESGEGRGFPFQIDHFGTSRAKINGPRSTYFAIFPEKLIDVIPGLSREFDGDLSNDREELIEQLDSNSNPPRDSDPDRRKAVELYAEQCAIEFYEGEGFELVDRPGKPFDLLLVRRGEELHVEVKGSSTAVDCVFLTKNEIAHAGGSGYDTDLYVVDQIDVILADGEYRCFGGRERCWKDWCPERDSLTALQFSYKLPDL